MRVLSARAYDYAGGSSFYDDAMKRWAAAEHAAQVLVNPVHSARYVFPTIGHNKLFLAVDAILLCAVELDDAAGVKE